MVKTSPSNAGGAGSIPGWGAKIPHASWPKNQNIKQKPYCNKFNKDFKNGPHQKKLLKKMMVEWSWFSLLSSSVFSKFSIMSMFYFRGSQGKSAFLFESTIASKRR